MGQLSTGKNERECEIARSLVSSSRAEPSIFYALAVSCTYEEKRKSLRCFGGSCSHTLRLTVVQGRFLATLEMTIREGIL